MSDQQQRALNQLYPTTAKAPAGPAVDAAGWIELAGGGWRKLPEHLARAPKPEKTPAQNFYGSKP